MVCPVIFALPANACKLADRAPKKAHVCCLPCCRQKTATRPAQKSFLHKVLRLPKLPRGLRCSPREAKPFGRWRSRASGYQAAAAAGSLAGNVGSPFPTFSAQAKYYFTAGSLASGTAGWGLGIEALGFPAGTASAPASSSGRMVMAMRRFLARPSAVALSAMGRYSP